MKYTKEEKIEWLMQYLSGMPLRYPPNFKKADFKKMIRYLEKRCQDHGETSSVVAVASRIDQVHEEGNREGRGRAEKQSKEIAGSASAKFSFYSWLFGPDSHLP